MSTSIVNDLIDHDAERAVLGAVLTQPDTIASLADWLPADAFGDRRNRAVWLAILRLWSRRQPATLVTVPAELLAMKPSANRDDLAAFVHDLYVRADPGAFAYASYHGEVILAMARRRAVADQGAALVRQAHQGEVAVEEGVRALRSCVEPFGGTTHDRPTFDDGIGDLQAEVLSRWDGTLVERVTPTGVAMLDRMLAGGLRGGDMLVLAARPSIGKTALMLHMAARSRSLVFSLEMPRKAIYNRIVSTEAGVSYDVAMTRVGDMAQRERWLEASERVRSWSLEIIDDIRTTAGIEAEVERRKLDGAVDAVFVDHIGWLSDPFPGKASQYDKVSALSRRCKELALRQDVPVVVVSQLNREVEHRSGCFPYMSDLRESGKIEEDADVIALMFRRAYYADKGMVAPDDEKDHILGTGWDRLSLNIAKNRNGSTGGVDLGWERQTMRVHEVDERWAA